VRLKLTSFDATEETQYSNSSLRGAKTKRGSKFTGSFLKIVFFGDQAFRRSSIAEQL